MPNKAQCNHPLRFLSTSLNTDSMSLESETISEESEILEDPDPYENGGSNPTQFREFQVDDLGRSYGTGRRKTAVARVWLKEGAGQCVVNKKNIAEYFPSGARSHALEPFLVTETAGMFDMLCTVKGGGQMGQAGAVRLGIARAIEAFQPGFKPLLKKHKLLTRDPRMVERKKPGLKKARKRKQWVKR
eukprot:CAMPEP_0116895020 /NCGR_PEP_ID=MMETSP0467-20121206/4635_1 /TAXON_ID=283647 /ORGANISM="Mesodinium pulex, Strain SPMC105" /LENGTH=187 /DNA_ID=CAMNT_0004565515 /DNA_START=59 /DNA_END=618 /DNA_ORIENTATION=+